MSLKIAMHPDQVIHRNGERQSYSDRWMQLARGRGIEPIPVDVFSPDIVSQIAACDAFMWRCDPAARWRLYAKRLLYAVEKGLDVPVFPTVGSSWHFEDKIAQYYFFSAAGIPTPATHIFWTREQAEQFCGMATYPFVLKLSVGYQASNVRLIHNKNDALYYVDQMFRYGRTGLGYQPASRPRLTLRKLRAASETLKGHNPYGPTPDTELQFGYFYAQEFLPDNKFDERITIVGNRAFGFRRFNRPDDFRASGSGNIDWDPQRIGEDAIRLAYRVARTSQAQAVGVDVLRNGSEPVVVELTLSFASWAIRECPGHWLLNGEPESGTLEWQEGSMLVEDAIFADFIETLMHSHNNT